MKRPRGVIHVEGPRPVSPRLPPVLDILDEQTDGWTNQEMLDLALSVTVTSFTSLPDDEELRRRLLDSWVEQMRRMVMLVTAERTGKLS